MSRRATAKRSAAPSPTPKSTEGGNPSGFILKLFQMVNGAPDDVVTVSKFFVPSFFLCSVRNGYLLSGGKFCKRWRPAAVRHITIFNIHSVAIILEKFGHLRYQHILCQHPPRHQIFFVCAGTSRRAKFLRAIVICATAKYTHFRLYLFVYYNICSHFFERRICSNIYQRASTICAAFHGANFRHFLPLLPRCSYGQPHTIASHRT